MIEIVIGDVHARAGMLRALLVSLGALDSRDRRRDGFWIVQVGDLLDRRASPEANLRTARLAARSIDVLVAGNHEVGMLAEQSAGQGASLATLAARGWPHAAAEVGGWLVTHAGVHPGLTHGLPQGADECAAAINDRWHRRSPDAIGDPLFDWVGPARGGVSPYGGVFWAGGSEWPPDGQTRWGQIHGHVPQVRPRLVRGPRWLIDLGADGSRLAALVRRQGMAKWRPVVIRQSARGTVISPAPHKRLGLIAA